MFPISKLRVSTYRTPRLRTNQPDTQLAQQGLVAPHPHEKQMSPPPEGGQLSPPSVHALGVSPRQTVTGSGASGPDRRRHHCCAGIQSRGSGFPPANPKYRPVLSRSELPYTTQDKITHPLDRLPRLKKRATPEEGGVGKISLRGCPKTCRSFGFESHLT